MYIIYIHVCSTNSIISDTRRGYSKIGIPTVATNVGNVKKIIKHEYNGFLVSSQKEWIESLVKLLKSESLRKKIGLRARKSIIENYSMNKIYKEYKKILYS